MSVVFVVNTGNNHNSVYVLLFAPTKSFRTLNLFSSQKTTTLSLVQIRFGLFEFKDKLKYLTI